MKVWMTALGALMLVSAACKPLVINGGGGGEGGSASNSSATGGAAVSTPSALAMRLADLPADSFDLLLETDPSQPPTDPDTLVLVFTSTDMSCSAPLTPPLQGECGPSLFWQLALFVPPALQGSGPIDLEAEHVYFYARELFPGNPDMCAGGTGAGPGEPGTLVIDSSDPSALTLTLSGGVTAMGETIDGTYVAASCP